MLNLVLTKSVNNVIVDGYSDGNTAWFSREQIGLALEYDDPRRQIARIHNRHKDRLDQFSTVVSLTTEAGEREGFMYNTRGVLEICRWSRQPKADMVMDALYDMAEEIMRKGYVSIYDTETLASKLIGELGYDHFCEDVFFPMLEAQQEFSFKQAFEKYAGRELNSPEAVSIANRKWATRTAEKQNRLGQFCHKENDFYDDSDMYKAILQFRWGAPQYRSHWKRINGVRWFDDHIMSLLTAACGRV